MKFDENGNIITKPLIRTDSKALAYLQKEALSGAVEGSTEGVVIHIFAAAAEAI